MLTKSFKYALKIGFSGLLFLIIIGYAFYRTKDLILGVKLEVSGIKDNSSYSSPLINISGRAKNASFVSLSGKEIYIDKDGYWNDKLLLMSGYNIITIEVKDKFGHQTRKNYQVFLKS